MLIFALLAPLFDRLRGPALLTIAGLIAWIPWK